MITLLLGLGPSPSEIIFSLILHLIMLLSQLLKPVSMMMWIIGTYGHGSVKVHTPTTIRLMDCAILSVRILPIRLKLIWYVRHVIILVRPVQIVPVVIHALQIERYQDQLYALVWIITTS